MHAAALFLCGMQSGELRQRLGKHADAVLASHNPEKPVTQALCAPAAGAPHSLQR